MPLTDDSSPLSLRATRATLRRLAGLPPQVLRVLAGRPVTVDGQRLRPEVQIAMRLLAAAPGEPIEKLPVPQARAELDAEAWLFGASTHIAAVTDTQVAGAEGELPARVYDPAPGSTPVGVLVWFHGGGFVLGGLDTSDAVCRFLARSSRFVIVSVDYRLAPEHPYPAGAEDAVAATRHVLAHLGDYGAGGARVVVGGESAGGGLAATVAQRVGGLAGQLLVNPWLELVDRSSSYELFGEGYTLTAEQLDWYRAHYLPDPALAEQASPARATDLTGLPPAVVLAFGFDPLRDEALGYARRLEDAGVPTEVIFEPGMPHSAINATGVSARVRELVDEAGQALRRLVGA